MKINQLVFAVLLTAAAVTASPPMMEWRGIVPLLSTRADVERLLGQPTNQSSQVSFYDLEDEGVGITYSPRRCLSWSVEAWDVPRDTVLSVQISPKKEVRLRDIQVDVSKYKKREHPYVAGRVTYYSVEEGVLIEADSTDPEHERVIEIEYGPKSKDRRLLCKSPRQ